MEVEAKLGRVANKREMRRKQQKLVAVEVMRDFGQNSTLHGLRYMTDKELSFIEKLFWTVTFFISVGCCFYMINNVWIKWKTSPIIVALDDHLVSIVEVPFPSVTICPHRKTKPPGYHFGEQMMKVGDKLENNLTWTQDEINEDPTVNKLEDIGLVCGKPELFRYGKRNYSDAQVVANLIEVSPNISDVFEVCRWRKGFVHCNELFKPVLTEDGVCFTMNALAADEMFRKENVQQDYFYLNSSEPSSGWSHTDGYSTTEQSVYPRRGQRSDNYPEVSLLLRGNNSWDPRCNGNKRGFKVYLHHPADMPQSSLHYYYVANEIETSFALKLNIFNTSNSLKGYPPETKRCYFPDERQLKYFNTYTSDNCRLECLSNYTYEQCGCVWFHMPHHNSSFICRECSRECVLDAADSFTAVEEGSTDSEADRCQCLETCVGVQYDAELLKTHNDSYTYREGYAHIVMYYKEARFLSIYRSELYGSTEFLANCGGLVGAFLGFSFLSLVEIFYFFTLRLGCILRRDKGLAENVSSKSEPVITRM